MINLNDFIIEKLKVTSSANVSKIDFDTFANALYIYSHNKSTKFDLENLDRYMALPLDEFPYFENPYSTTNAKGYIKKMYARKILSSHKSGYNIFLLYSEVNDKTVIGVTTINKDHFNVLTDAIEPEILHEIYDYLIENA